MPNSPPRAGWNRARAWACTWRRRASACREDEREKRLDEAVSRFVHDVIVLDYAADEVLGRIDQELRAFAPRKTA